MDSALSMKLIKTKQLMAILCLFGDKELNESGSAKLCAAEDFSELIVRGDEVLGVLTLNVDALLEYNCPHPMKNLMFDVSEVVNFLKVTEGEIVFISLSKETSNLIIECGGMSRHFLVYQTQNPTFVFPRLRSAFQCNLSQREWKWIVEKSGKSTRSRKDSARTVDLSINLKSFQAWLEGDAWRISFDQKSPKEVIPLSQWMHSKLEAIAACGCEESCCKITVLKFPLEHSLLWTFQFPEATVEIIMSKVPSKDHRIRFSDEI